MFEDLKIEYQIIKELHQKLKLILELTSNYIQKHYCEFYDSNAISLNEIENYILFLKRNILDGDNKKQLLIMQIRLNEGIVWATNTHLFLTKKQLQRKQIILRFKNNHELTYEVPYIENLFQSYVDFENYYKANIAYFPSHLRKLDFEKLDYVNFEKELSKIIDDYELRIIKKEDKKRKWGIFKY